MSFLGLDVGTTGCKAVAVDGDGRVIAQAYRDYPLVSPQPGWNELDSGLLWKSIIAVISAAARQTGTDPVRAVSVSSQGEAVAPVGKLGDTLYNFIVTFDNRTEPQVCWWEKKLDRKALFRMTGMPLHPMYSINKILWIRENRPELYAEAWKFLCIEDFVIFKLSAITAIDYSLAARTMCFDVSHKEWSEKILSLADVDAGLLSETMPSGSPVGTVRSDLAGEMGLGKGVVVATGGHDQPCGSLGAGAVRPGMVMNAIGTSDVLCPTLEKPVLTADMMRNNYCCYPHVLRDVYTSITFNLTGGLLLRWYRDTLCQDEVREAHRTHADPYEIIIGRASPQPVDLYVLPHFVGSGTPTLDSRSHGAIVGITLQTTKGDLTRALLDSNNYDVRLNLDTLRGVGVPVEELRVIGGGSKSAAWLQMRADVLGTPLSVPQVSEAASYGAAILAGVSVGHFPDARAGAQSWVKVARTYQPDMGMHEKYAGRYANYLKLYPSLRKAGITYP
ncbi:MAG: FGGY family carbohydrate kinase [Spirochaetia bacterium]|jgi:xylulokinase